MEFSVLSWLLAGVLAVTCLAVARSAWNIGGRPPGISRMALVSAVLEAAATAAFFRLLVPWGTGTTLLWVVAMAGLAAAVAGTVIRWPELPSHAGLLDFAEPEHEGEEPGTADPGTADPGTAGTAGTAGTPGTAGAAGTLRTKPRKQQAKKPKKREPGRKAVAVRAGVLAALIAVSVAIG